MKYQTSREAMTTKEGEALYRIISASFDEAVNMTGGSVVQAMTSSPCYLGSAHHIEKLVWAILNNTGSLYDKNSR